MYRVTTRYERVSRTAPRSGACSVCGAKGKRQKRFSQTLNPYNRNDQGLVKTYDEIQSELVIEVKEWSEGQFVHERCEGLL